MHLADYTTLQKGKYRIIKVLGQGGFGITYLSYDVMNERYVAVKEFFPKGFCVRNPDNSIIVRYRDEKINIEKLRQRFIKEARNLSILSHPFIVKIHDVFEENKTAYYAMDYIEGENLNNIIKNNGPLSEKKALEYIYKIGDAVDYIHSRKITHFDIKPSNIMLRSCDDTPILIDFGLSKDFSGGEASTILKAVSDGYSPIELYHPNSMKDFSPESDIYSLAATLYYFITRSVPPSAINILSDNVSLIFPQNISTLTQNAIIKGMTWKKSDRPRLVQSFTDILSGYDNLNEDYHTNHKNASHFNKESTNGINDPSDTQLHTESSTEFEKNKTYNLWFMIVGIVVILLVSFVVIGYYIDFDFNFEL